MISSPALFSALIVLRKGVDLRTGSVLFDVAVGCFGVVAAGMGPTFVLAGAGLLPAV
jgi:hypothetical protein